MNCCSLIYLWITLLIFTSGPPKASTIKCFDCEYILKPGENYDIETAEPCFWLEDPKTNTSRECQPHEDACYMYVVKRNSVITTYRRNCIEKIKCLEGCIYEGLGYLDEKCTTCCNTTDCNDVMAGNTTCVNFNPLVLVILTLLAMILIYDKS